MDINTLSTAALTTFDESTIPEIKRLRDQLSMKEAELKSIERANVKGKKSSMYIEAESKLEKLRKVIPDKIEELKLSALRMKSEGELLENMTQLKQKENLLDRLEVRFSELRDELAADGNNRLEFQFASQELQRALNLFAKISERESELSATVGLPKELADELWGNNKQPSNEFVPSSNSTPTQQTPSTQ